MVEYIEEKMGVMVSKAPDGRLVMTKWKLPFDFGGTQMGWTSDFFRALEEFGWLRLWLLRLIMGRYAFREMVGMFDDLKERGCWTPDIGYGLGGMDYHKEKVSLKFKD